MQQTFWQLDAEATRKQAPNGLEGPSYLRFSVVVNDLLNCNRIELFSYLWFLRLCPCCLSQLLLFCWKLLSLQVSLIFDKVESEVQIVWQATVRRNFVFNHGIVFRVYFNKLQIFFFQLRGYSVFCLVGKYPKRLLQKPALSLQD